MVKSKAKKPTISWGTMSNIEDIQPRKGRHGKYCVLYTMAGNFCCSENIANRLSLFEPYELSGEVKMVNGGTYLWVNKARLFDARAYTYSGHNT